MGSRGTRNEGRTLRATASGSDLITSFSADVVLTVMGCGVRGRGVPRRSPRCPTPSAASAIVGVAKSRSGPSYIYNTRQIFDRHRSWSYGRRQQRALGGSTGPRCPTRRCGSPMPSRCASQKETNERMLGAPGCLRRRAGPEAHGGGLAHSPPLATLS